MKKTTLTYAILALFTISMAATATAFATNPTQAEACKALGDFIDNRPWDVELQPILPGYYDGTQTLYCFDPVDKRFYEANTGAMRIVYDR